VGDLSGGERRRLQLTRLLMAGPNVLILDEPTNDFDVETLTALEDLLDSFGGTILVISHDRYFLERVCDRFVGLLGDGAVRDLPNGVDEYLKLRRRSASISRTSAVAVATAEGTDKATKLNERSRKKDLVRLERQLQKLATEEASLHDAMTEHATDHEKVAELHAQLNALLRRKSDLEDAWLVAADPSA
jgi:ATP-binding cassette subfamily F protein uup